MYIVKIIKIPKRNQEEETILDFISVPQTLVSVSNTKKEELVLTDSGYQYLETLGYVDRSMQFDFVTKEFVLNYKNKLIRNINENDRMISKILKIEENADTY